MSAFENYPGLTISSGYTGVMCPTCRASVGERCKKGGMSWPEPATRPHFARRDGAYLIGWWEDFGRSMAKGDA